MTEIDRQAAFSGTKDVAPALAIDADASRRLSDENHPRLRRPADRQAIQAAGSRTRPICWRRRRATMCCAGSRRASCCPPRMRSIANSASSRRCMRRSFPVPEPLLYCADDSVAGTAFYVMGFARRPRVLGAGHAGLRTRPNARRSTTRMNATLAQLHTFDPAKIGLGDFGRGEDYVARQVERWSKQYRASETETIADMEQLMRLAAAASAAAAGRAHRAWRLSPRQHDHRITTDPKSSRCSTGNCRRSAIRSPISPIT